VCLESGVPAVLPYQEEDFMQNSEAYVGGEQSVDVADRQRAAREMEDLVSRRRPSFYRARIAY